MQRLHLEQFGKVYYACLCLKFPPGRRLMEIESRLLPCGLHVVGEPPSAMEAIATLVNIAEIDRPDLEKPIRGLPGILARSIKRNVEEIYKANNQVHMTWLLVHWLWLFSSHEATYCVPAGCGTSWHLS